MTGRIINLAGDNIMLNSDMFNPEKLANVNRKDVDTVERCPISMMPTGLIDTLQAEEVMDLVAYLLSRGERGGRCLRGSK